MTEGKTYDGDWLNGMMHGNGVITNREGIKKVGEWNKGSRVRWVE